ncbi:MAG: tRNA-binding protein [Flavobacterium sp.]
MKVIQINIQNLSNMLSWEDFEKVDMRVGTILEVKEFPNAKKPAYQLAIDFGSLGIKKSSAQITDHYTPVSLIHQQVIAVVNFPPKQIANFISECLVLGLVQNNGSVVLLQPQQKVDDGIRVW